jgi:hypothetical protein
MCHVRSHRAAGIALVGMWRLIGPRIVLVVSWRTPAGEDAQTRLSWKRAS